MRNAVTHSVFAGGRAIALGWRASTISLRRGIWRATRIRAGVHSRSGDDDSASTPRDAHRGVATGASVEGMHRVRGPQRPWVLASVLGFAGIAVLVLLHLFDADGSPRTTPRSAFDDPGQGAPLRTESLADEGPKEASLTVAHAPPARDAALPRAAATWTAQLEPPDEFDDRPLGDHPSVDGSAEPPLVQIDPPLSEFDPPSLTPEPIVEPEPEPVAEPAPLIDPAPLIEPAELSVDVRVADAVPPPTETVSDAPTRFFVTSTAPAAKPPIAQAVDPPAADDGAWRTAVAFSSRIDPKSAVRTVSLVQSSASASSATRVEPSPLTLAVDPPAATRPGGVVQVPFRVTNSGEAVAEGVLLLVDLPDGLSHPHGRTLEHPLDPLAPGETRVVRLVVTVEEAGEHSLDARLAVGESEGSSVAVLLRCAASESPPGVPQSAGLPRGFQSPSWCDCIP